MSYTWYYFKHIATNGYTGSIDSDLDYLTLYYFTSPYITATITDSSDNVLCIDTTGYNEVDSSTVLTFGAIDETYVRKTELESLISRIAALESKA